MTLPGSSRIFSLVAYPLGSRSREQLMSNAMATKNVTILFMSVADVRVRDLAQ